MLACVLACTINNIYLCMYFWKDLYIVVYVWRKIDKVTLKM